MKKLLAIILVISALSALLTVASFAEDNIYNKILIVNLNLPASESANSIRPIENEQELELLIEYAKMHLVSDEKANTVKFTAKLTSTSDFEEDRHLFEALPGVKASLATVTPNVTATVTVKVENLKSDVLLSLTKIDCVETVSAYTKIVPGHIYPDIVMKFTDVPEDAWYSEYVGKAYFYGIMEGTYNEPPTVTFEPNATLTRAMLVTMIGRFEERLYGELTVSTDTMFTDVKAGKWYSDYVAWAAEKGVVEGYPDGTFRPNAPVTREEAITILGRYCDKNLPKSKWHNNMTQYYFPYTDTAEISGFAKEWVKYGIEIDAVHYEKADHDSTLADAPECYFEPKRSMTRAEVAKVAYAFLSYLEANIENGFRTPEFIFEAVTR